MRIIVTVIAIIIALFVFVYCKQRRQNYQLNQQRFDRVKPLYEKLENGEVLTMQEVLPYTENISARELTFQLLEKYKKTDLFPPEYYTLIKGAESNLANRLEFPTELDACPDEIVYVQRVTFSRIDSTVDKVTPEEDAKWVHENLAGSKN